MQSSTLYTKFNSGSHIQSFSSSLSKQKMLKALPSPAPCKPSCLQQSWVVQMLSLMEELLGLSPTGFVQHRAARLGAH